MKCLILSLLFCLSVSASGKSDSRIYTVNSNVEAFPVFVETDATCMVFDLNIRSESDSLDDKLQDIQLVRDALMAACAEAKFDLRVNRAFEFSHSYSKYSFSSSVDNPNVEGSMSIVVPLKAETDLVHVARKARQIVSKLKLPKKASVHVVNTGLGIGNPEEFRLPILEAIRVYLEETNKALGDGYEVSIEGITGSVRARQSGERKVQLYIPFSIVLNSR